MATNLQDYARQIRQGDRRRPSPFVVALLARKKELNMRRATLARLAGVGEETIRQWERGRQPAIDSFAAVAQVLGLRLTLNVEPAPAE